MYAVRRFAQQIRGEICIHVLDTDSFFLRDTSPAHRFVEIGFIIYFFRFPITASLSLVNIARNCQIIQAALHK